MTELIKSTKDLSLYLHIPFCSTKCSYCSFYSLPKSEYEKGEIASYVKKLVEEISSLNQVRDTPYKTAFIGGGNPGLLSLEHLREILRAITACGVVEEVSIEINPSQVRPQLSSLKEVGLTRLSVGIQTLSDTHLATLGRVGSKEENIEALKIAKALPFSLNVDLITCIPGQTIEDALFDIEHVVQLSHPDHISLYNLTIEEGSVLATKEMKLFDEESEEQILRACWNKLEELGYHHYEVSNFALSKEKRCKHNERYWKLENYIGLGASAVGTIGQNGRAVRISSKPSLSHYLLTPLFGSYTYEELNEFEVIEEMLLVGLRRSDGIDKRLWKKRFRVDFDQQFAQPLAFLDSYFPTFFTNSEERFFLHSEALMLCDAIIYRFVDSIEMPLDS